MNEPFEKIEALLQSGDFRTLGTEDQHWIKENFGGADAFDHLRQTVLMAQKEKTKPVRAHVKSDLMKQFKSKHQPAWKLLLQWKIPMHLAFLMMFVFSAILMVMLPVQERVVEKYVQQDPIIDTVFIASEPDTVFIERTIERPVYVKMYQEVEEEPVLVAERRTKGKSLADQSEIKDILVSGR